MTSQKTDSLPEKDQKPEKTYTRRGFCKLTTSVAIKTVSVGAIAGLPSFGALYFNVDTFKLEKRYLELSFPHLPDEFDGYKFAYISDFHLGVSMPDKFVNKVFSEIKDEKPEALLMGGDYIYIPSSILASTSDILRNARYSKLKYAVLARQVYDDIGIAATELGIPDGVFAVMGNHDRWHKPSFCISSFEKYNINLLINDYAEITRGQKKIRIVGVDDYLTGFPIYPKDIINDNSVFKILLSHNPDYVADLITNSIPKDSKSNSNSSANTLSLCGHTHAGQIRLPLFNFSPIVRTKVKSLFEGLHVHESGLVNYTSRGVGSVGIPIRIACRPEIVFITLRKGLGLFDS